jgi:hypothetical protein
VVRLTLSDHVLVRSNLDGFLSLQTVTAGQLNALRLNIQLSTCNKAWRKEEPTRGNARDQLEGYFCAEDGIHGRLGSPSQQNN